MGQDFMYEQSLQEMQKLIKGHRNETVDQCISLWKKNRVEKVSTFAARAKRVMHIWKF